MLAAYYGRLDMVEYLAPKMADLNATNEVITL